MRACAFCKTRYQKGSEITFHKFPIDSTRQLWLDNMKISNWSPKISDYLCSKHFTDDCFSKHVARTNLKSGSVPTCFSEDTSSNQNDDVKTATPLSCDSGSTILKAQLSSVIIDKSKACLNSTEPTGGSEKEPRTLSEVCKNIKHDHRYQKTPRSTVKALRRIEKALQISRSRVKLLSQQVRRLKQKIS